MIFMNNLYKVDSIIEKSVSSIRYHINLIADSVIFKSHFPSEPIMPGACIVQLVNELFELWTGQEAEIQRINNLKFLSPVSPAIVSTLDVFLVVNQQDLGTMHLKAVISAGEKVFSRMSLELVYRDNR